MRGDDSDDGRSRGIGRRALIGRSLVGATSAAALLPTRASAAPPDVGELDIRSFGAVGDGTTDDSAAFQSALNALIANGGGELLITNGVYKIANPITANGLNKASSIVIRGLGSSAQILIASGPQNTAISLLNLESVLVEDLVFAGTAGQATDALIALNFGYCLQATIRSCGFYGVSSRAQGGGVVVADHSDLHIEDTGFHGCGAASGYGTCVVSNTNWTGLTITTTDFIDYGYLNGTYMSKTPIAAPAAWVGVFDTTQSAPPSQRAIQLTNVNMDEGAEYGMTCRPSLLPGGGLIESVTISGLRINCAGFAVPNNGLIIQNVQHLLVERSWFGYTPQSGKQYPSRNMVALYNVADAVIDACRGDNGADRITANYQVGTLTVRETLYQHLISQATNTQVIQNGVTARLLACDGAISANSAVVQSPTTAQRIVVAPPSAPASAILGVALDATVNPGDTTRVVQLRGLTAQVRSDGTAPIALGDPVGPSSTAAGAVATIASGGLIGRAVIAAPKSSAALTTIELLDGIVPQAQASPAQLQNGWTNAGGSFAPAVFTKTPDGRVALSGVVQSGTTDAGTTLLTLPAGYRPRGTELFAVTTSGGHGEVAVAADGTVSIRQAVASGYVSLSGINFAGS